MAACSEEKEKEPVVSVQISPVETVTIQHTVDTEAILYARQQAAIMPKISAPVQRFLVQRGSRVHRGELLAVLENRDLNAAAQENKGDLEEAQAAYETATVARLPEEIQKAEADMQEAQQALDALQRVYQSRQQLFAQGALPRKELDQSRVDVTQARNQAAIAKKHLEVLMAVGKQQQLRAAAGQLESAKGKYLGAEAQLSYSEIRSPIDGVVTERPLYPGEMANLGNPIVTVMDISSVIAKAHIPQADSALLKVGDQGIMMVPGMPKPIEGTVTVVSPALDPNSTTVEIWLEAKNPRHELKPGTSVHLSLLAKTAKDALVVPKGAVLTAPDGSSTVMVAGKDGRAHQRTVKVGIRQGDQVQIIEGVSTGENVVSMGAYALPDNVQISVEARSKSPEDPSDRPTASEK
ncbi:MAG TPA: efflux RND transporter periplasmic adaptor subunit [Candidatus Aquilonibacter sp.]|nr:efflux RND transporter periplasmic adaptor subunit [Candidatus Aquilonibacter sp.]